MVLELFYSMIKSDEDDVVDISCPAKHSFHTENRVENNTMTLIAFTLRQNTIEY